METTHNVSVSPDFRPNVGREPESDADDSDYEQKMRSFCKGGLNKAPAYVNPGRIHFVRKGEVPVRRSQDFVSYTMDVDIEDLHRVSKAYRDAPGKTKAYAITRYVQKKKTREISKQRELRTLELQMFGPNEKTLRELADSVNKRLDKATTVASDFNATFKEIEPRLDIALNVAHEVAQDFSKVAIAASELPRQLSEFNKSFNTGIERIAHVDKSIQRTAQDAALKIEQSFAGLSHTAGSVTMDIMLVPVVCLFMKAGYDFFHKPSVVSAVLGTATASILTARLAIHCAGTDTLALLNRISSLFSTGKLELQGAGDDTLVGQIVALVMSYTVFKSAPPGKAIKEVVTTLSHFKTLREGSTDAFNTIVSLLQRCIDILADCFGLTSLRLVKTGIPELEEWTKKTEIVLNAHNARTLTQSSFNREHINGLITKGITLCSKFPHGKDRDIVKDTVNLYLRRLDLVKTAMDGISAGSAGPRMDPLAIALVGPTNIGKSAGTYPLILAVAREVFKDDRATLQLIDTCPNDLFYFDNAANGFLDGYAQQWAFVMDDFNHFATQGTLDGQEPRMYFMKNILPNMLHRAELQNKGNCEFRSEFIVATSNKNWFTHPMLADERALNRRFDLKIRQAIKKEYSTEATKELGPDKREIDWSKVGVGFHPEIWEFREYDLVSGQGAENLGPVMDFAQVVKLIADRFRVQKHRAAAYINDVWKQHHDEIGQRLGRPATVHTVPTPIIQLQGGDVPDDVVRTREYAIAQVYCEIYPNARPEVLKPYKLFQVPLPDKRRMCDMVFVRWSDLRDRCDLTRDYFELLGLADRLMIDGDVEWCRISRFTLDELQMGNVETRHFTVPDDGPQLSGMEPIENVVNNPRYLPLNLAVVRALRWRGDKWADDKYLAHKITLEYLEANLHTPDVAFEKNCLDLRKNGFTAQQLLDFCKRAYPDLSDKSIDELKTSTKTFSERFKEQLLALDWVRIALGLVAGTIALWGFAKLIKHLTGPSTESQSVEKGEAKVRVINLPLSELEKPGPKPIEPQSADPTAEDIAICLFKKNMRKIMLGDHCCGHIFLPGGSDFLVNTHICKMLARIRSEHKIQTLMLKSETSAQSIEVLIADFEKAVPLCPSEGYDISRGVISNPSWAPAPSVYDKLIKASFFKPSATGMLVVPRGDHVQLYIAPIRSLTETVRITGKDVTAIVTKGYTMNVATLPGDCGSLLLLVDPTTGGHKVLGMHAAGDRQSFAVVCSFSAEDVPKPQSPQIQLQSSLPLHTRKLAIMDDRFPVVGEAPRAHSSGETSIRPSVFMPQRWTEPITAPAALKPFERDGVRIDPVKKAASNYSPPIPYLDPAEIQAAIDLTCDNILHHEPEPRTSPKVLSFEQAVKGVEGVPEFGSIPRMTSAGYPFVLQTDPKHPGKTLWFGDGETIDLDHPKAAELKSQVHHKLNLMKQGIMPDFIFLDFLKDERRKIPKVEAGDTRQIAGSPLDLTIIHRMLFGDFHIAAARGKVLNGLAMGMNPYSHEWGTMVDLIKKIGPNLMAGDVPKWDTRQVGAWFSALAKYISRFYNDGPEMEKARELALLALWNSLHITGGTVYQMFSSMPSGAWLTLLFNSIICIAIAVYCYGKLHPAGFHNVRTYFKNVFSITQGDDHIHAVSPTCPWFNMISFKDALEKHFWMGYTDARKKPVDKPYVTLSEATFMKRAIRFEPEFNRWMAPLELEAVLEPPLWTKKGPDADKIAFDTFHASFRELSLHDVKVWNEWAPKMAASWQKVTGIPYPHMNRVFLAQSTFDSIFYMAGVPPPSLLLKLSTEQTRERPDLRTSDGGVDHIHGTAQSHVKQSKGPGLGLGYHCALAPNRTVTETNKQSTKTDAEQILGTMDVANSRLTTTSETIAPLTRPDVLTNLVSTGVEQSILTFLAKPIVIGTGTIGTATTGVVDTWDLPADWLLSNLISQKLAGYQGFSGTFKLRLLTNANTMQQGRLLLCYVPQATVPNVQSSTRFAYNALATQLPGVQMDVSCDSEVELDIPYTSPLLFHNLIDNTGQWARVALRVLSPLAVGTGGSSTFSYTLYCSMDPSTVRLYNPTYNAALEQQSNDPTESYDRSIRPRGKKMSKAKAMYISDTEAQGGKVSQTVGKLSKVAGLAALVPALTEFAAPVAWGLDILKQGLNIFGFSKPRLETPAARMTRALFPYSANCDVPDSSYCLGAFSSNKLEVLPSWAGSNVDEMSMDFVLTKSALIDSFTMTTTNAAGDLLFSKTLSPTSPTVTLASPTRYIGPPMTYIANFFEYYRGDIKVTFKVVKTVYHEGRVLVAFFPGLSVAPAFATTSYPHSLVLDLSLGNEFSIVFPYTSNSMYLQTSVAYGVLGVYALNALTAPSTVSTGITFLVEYSAMPGFEFAFPRSIGITIALDANPLAVPPTKAKQHVLAKQIELQSSEPNPCVIQQSVPIGGSQVHNPLSIAPAKYCIGERIISLKQMILRPTPLRMFTVAPSGIVGFRPFTTGAAYVSGTSLLANSFANDLISNLSSLYAYQRGGVVYKIYVRQNANANAAVQFQAYLTKTLSSSEVQLTTQDPEQGNCAGMYVSDSGTVGGIDITVPAYSPNVARLIRYSISSNDEPLDNYTSDAFVQTLIGYTSDPPTTGIFCPFRGAADDFMFGGFLGTLPWAYAVVPNPNDVPNNPSPKSGLPVDSLPPVQGSPQASSGSQEGKSNVNTAPFFSLPKSQASVPRHMTVKLEP